jgi:xanthine dehydrogenase accessory factor
MSDTATLNDDAVVLEACLRWAAAGDEVALVTVMRTWGSSPRPPGSLLAIRRRDGRQAGSVSGGCVESDLVERYRRGDIADTPTTIDYGVDPEGAARFGLPCGGRLELLVEEPPAAALAPLLQAIRDGRLLERRVCLNTGEASLHDTGGHQGFRLLDDTVCKRYGPAWQLLLIGAGQIADHLARIATSLGFAVTLCDPREAAVTGGQGLTLSRAMPDDAVAAVAVPRRTAVVTLAHDPRIDDMALMEALRGEFFYVGALGSRRTSAARRERLLTLDLDAGQVARLHAPVGLPIGSRTPAEIAVAIAAELVAARHGVRPTADAGADDGSDDGSGAGPA